MRFKEACVATFVLAILLFFGPSAEAQLAKSGTYSGWFGWHSYGQTTDMGGKDSYWYGALNGAFRNDAGSGFMHNAAVICPGGGATIDGKTYVQGDCVLTDQDGDKAILIWDCAFDAQGRCPGPLTWVVGTGKYKGISGKGTFDGGFVRTGPQGYSFWKGEWKLPQ